MPLQTKHIFGNGELQKIAEAAPTKLVELTEALGLNDMRSEKYGGDMVLCVLDFLQEQHMSLPPLLVTPPTPTGGGGSSGGVAGVSTPAGEGDDEGWQSARTGNSGKRKSTGGRGGPQGSTAKRQQTQSRGRGRGRGGGRGRGKAAPELGQLHLEGASGTGDGAGRGVRALMPQQHRRPGGGHSTPKANLDMRQFVYQGGRT